MKIKEIKTTQIKTFVRFRKTDGKVIIIPATKIVRLKEAKKMYVITANVRGTRDTITKPASLSETRARLKSLQKQMRMVIPKYKWAKEMRIIKV